MATSSSRHHHVIITSSSSSSHRHGVASPPLQRAERQPANTLPHVGPELGDGGLPPDSRAAAANGPERISLECGTPMRPRVSQLSEREREVVSQRARQRVARLLPAATNHLSADTSRSEQLKTGPEPEPEPDTSASSTPSSSSASRTTLPAGDGQADGLAVVLEGPRGHRHPMVLGAQDSLAAVLSEAAMVGVSPHDAAVWLPELPGRRDTPVQLAFVGRSSAKLLVIGASPLISGACLEPGMTLFVRSRVDNSSIAEALDNETATELPQRQECRICGMGNDEDDSDADDDLLIAPCGCSGTVKFVHVSCLQEWRRRNIAQSRFCSVCSQPYNCIRDASTQDYLSYHCAQLLRAPAASTSGVCLKFIRHVWVDHCSVHLSCLLTRMMGTLLLLLACAVIGRLLASLISELVHSVLLMDAVLDKVLLPDTLVDVMNRAFPPLPYVLSSATTVASSTPVPSPSTDDTATPTVDSPTTLTIEVSSSRLDNDWPAQLQPTCSVCTTAAEPQPVANAAGNFAWMSTVRALWHQYIYVIGAKMLSMDLWLNQTVSEAETSGSATVASVGRTQSHSFAAFASAINQVHIQWLHWNTLSLSMSWEDVVLGVLTWSFLLSWVRRLGDSDSAFEQRFRALLPWVQSPLTLLSDLANLVHALFPSMLASVHGLTFILPASSYLVRRWLHAVGTVDMGNRQMVVDFRNGHGIGLHILLVLAAVTILANAFGALYFVCRHQHEWRVNNSYISYPRGRV